MSAANQVDAARLALQAPGLRAQAAFLALQVAGRFGRDAIQGRPPLQHILPVLALADAAAGLALLFGDPAFIDIVAEEARRALRDGTVTTQDIFGRTSL